MSAWITWTLQRSISGCVVGIVTVSHTSQLAAQIQRNDAYILHANTLLPLAYQSQQDFDTRVEVGQS
jgi:hypothetical protein